jgi:hypothetical protein
VRSALLPAVVAAGVCLHLPSLGAGFFVDDHAHQLALQGEMPLRPWSLYDFGETKDWAHVEGVGGIPWWTSLDWKIRFFRPLSSLLLAADHALFGADPMPYHVVSLAWLALLLTASYAMYRALGLSRGVATGAVAFLAASQATAFPADWIANRNSLVAATFTAAAVAAIASHARLGKGCALAVALLAAVLAALSKESGLVALAGVAGWLLVADHGLPAAWARRGAAACVGTAVLWVVGLALAGYGTRSAFYATPWSDPGRFAGNLGLLATIGPLALLTPVPADLAFLQPDIRIGLAVAGVAVGVPVAVWAARRLRGDPTAAYLALWTAVALVPEAGAPLGERLLLTPTIGAAGLLAMLVARTLPRAAGRSVRERWAAGTLVATAGILPALMTGAQSAASAASADQIRSAVLAADVGPPSAGHREVVLLQATDPLIAFALSETWAFSTLDRDLRFTLLQTGRRGLHWTRPDERTMVFTSLDRPFVTDPFELVYLARPGPPTNGSLAAIPGIRFEVAASDADGSVRAVRLRFDEAPDGPRWRFLVPRDGRLAHVDPPAPGTSLDLPAAPKSHPFVP